MAPPPATTETVLWLCPVAHSSPCPLRKIGPVWQLGTQRRRTHGDRDNSHIRLKCRLSTPLASERSGHEKMNHSVVRHERARSLGIFALASLLPSRSSRKASMLHIGC